MLVDRHIDFVFATSMRRVANDTYLADEVTQAVFVALARKAGMVLRHPFLSGWLHRSTHYAMQPSTPCAPTAATEENKRRPT